MDSKDSIAKKAWLGVGGPYNVGNHSEARSAGESVDSSKIGAGSSNIDRDSRKFPQYDEALGI